MPPKGRHHSLRSLFKPAPSVGDVRQKNGRFWLTSFALASQSASCQLPTKWEAKVFERGESLKIVRRMRLPVLPTAPVCALVCGCAPASPGSRYLVPYRKFTYFLYRISVHCFQPVSERPPGCRYLPREGKREEGTRLKKARNLGQNERNKIKILLRLWSNCAIIRIHSHPEIIDVNE